MALSCAAMVVVVRDGQNRCGARCSSQFYILKFCLHVFPSFPGKRVVEPGDNEGDEPKEVYYLVPCRAVERIGGYTLTGDDPAVFTDRITYVDHPKELPEPYPEGADTDPSGISASTSSSKKATPPPSPSKRNEMEALLTRMHYELHKLAKNAGIPDICAKEKATRLENVIAGLTSKDLVCRYCKKKYSSLTNLKNHLKHKHLKKTAHYCDICKKYFSEASSLITHNQRHAAGAQQFQCSKKVTDKKGKTYTCGKVFYSQKKFLDHSTVHSKDKPFLCQFCEKKSFKRKKTMVEHQTTCDKNPDKLAMFRCRLCPKEYPQKRSLQRHFRTSHPGEDPDL